MAQFYIEAVQDCQVFLLTNGNVDINTGVTFQYSYDGSTWNTWSFSEKEGGDFYTNRHYEFSGLPLLQDKKLYIRGNNPNGINQTPTSSSPVFRHYWSFLFRKDTSNSDPVVNLGGDIRYLINYNGTGTTVPCDYCFYELFATNYSFSLVGGIKNCDPDLLVGYTNLTKYCYSNMFALNGNQYDNSDTFNIAPTLPVTTLAEGCYDMMFFGCSNLSYIKCLATDISATNCTADWTQGVSSTGTFVKDENMTSWTSGNNGIPTNWTVKNSGDSGMEIKFRKNGTSEWLSGMLPYQEIAETGGTQDWDVGFVLDSSNYSCGVNSTLPTGWSILSISGTTVAGTFINTYRISFPPSTGSTPETALIEFYLADGNTHQTVYNSLPLSADSIYTSYLYVGDEGMTATTMEASWEGEYDSDFHTYYWQENIDHFTLSADVDWITDIWTDDEDEEIGCYVEPNYGLAPRTGTITVVGTDTIGRTHTCTIVINQEWYVRYPIWQDVYFTGATDTLDYYIAMDSGSATRDIIYQGRAYLQPNQSNVKINISKICQNYLSNNIEDGNSIPTINNINANSMKRFYIYNASGDTQLSAYTYVYDWSYGDLSADGILTKPINGHADSRMVKLGTSVEPSLYYRNHPIPSIYTSGYCGDYAIYYLQRNGGWAAFLIEGNSKKTDRYEKYSYNMAFDNNKAMFEESTYHLQITAEWQLSTGWLTDEQAENLAFNLIPSNRVFLHDLNKDKIIPVIVSNDSIDYKTFKNTGRQLVRYDITLTESQKKQML